MSITDRVMFVVAGGTIFGIIIAFLLDGLASGSTEKSVLFALTLFVAVTMIGSIVLEAIEGRWR